MAKRRSTPMRYRKNGNDNEPEVIQNQFTTGSGRVITFEPANSVTLQLIESGVRQDYKERGEPIDPPTYKVKTVGGAEQEFIHDAKTVEGKPELELVWKDHEDAVRRLTAETNKVKFEYALECITNELPEDDSWIERQRKKYIKVPDDPEERRLHYITTELIRTPEDSIRLMMEVTTAGLRGVLNEEDINAVRENFRRFISDGNRDDSIADRLNLATSEAVGELDSLDPTD